MLSKVIKDKRLVIAIVVIIAAAIVTTLVLHFNRTAQAGNQTTGSVIDVRALKTAGHSVETDSGFVLTCSEKMSEQQVRESIEVMPLISYTLKKQSDSEYLLNFDSELEANSIVSFRQISQANPNSWAFQTKNVFKVVHTLPGDKATTVPVNTGIEVELSFLDVTNFKESFKIEPTVSGRFERHGKTWVFIPEKLQEDTLYKVTIDKGLNTSGGELLGEDYSFSFRTQKDYPKGHGYLYIGGEAAETFTPDANPIIELGASEKYSDKDFTVQIYKYPDAEAYLGALRSRHDYIHEQLGYGENYLAPTASLERVMSFETKLSRQNPEQIWMPAYIVLPDKLPEGHYLADITVNGGEDGEHLQKFIQINRYAVYALSVKGAQLVWVNDTGTGEPAQGIEVDINGASAKTGSDGTVRIDTPALDPEKFTALTVKGGGQPFVTGLAFAMADERGKVNEQYYTYIYTDRARYQPTDTISVWGVVLSRDGKSRPPKEAELQLKLGFYGESSVKTGVSLDESGAFSGKVAISGLASNYYQLGLVSGDITYCTTYVEVGEYTKPSYLIDVSFDKPVYFAWEPINLNARVSFFDGTPAGNMPFEIYNGCTDARHKAASDELGAFSRRLEYRDEGNSCYPQALYYSVTTAAAEDARSYRDGYVWVLPRDIFMQAEFKRSGDSGYIEVKTNHIEISSVKSPQDVYSGNYENIKGKAADIPVTARIFEVTWNKVQRGSYYDYINKVVVPLYEYERSERQVEVKKGVTSNGSLVFDTLDYTNSPERYYYADIECADTQGRAIKERAYFYVDMYPKNYNIKSYSFSQKGCQNVSVDETVRIELLENSQPVLKQGRILYATVQNSLREYKTVDATSFDYTFSKADIPNIQIFGAFFDGKNIYPVWQQDLRFNPDERRLTVDTVPSGDSFLPGSEMELQIRVTDKNNRPVPNAAVCVSVVDEAAFAVADQNPDPLRDIYSKYFYPHVTTYVSYTQHDFSGDGSAEGGGEGGSTYVRKNFLDTAAFLTAITGKDGSAKVSFKLPDNLTSWRVTSLAVSDGVFAGNSRTNIKTTQPFFADLLVNKVFIKGDTLSASVRGFGTALKSGEKVDFGAVLTYPDGTEKSFEGSGRASGYVNLNFGTGPEGDYKLTVTAKSQAGTDAVEKGFRVVKSALEIPVTKSFSLSGGIDINALRSPVTLAFFDRSQALYYECLQSLASGTGVRADLYISRAVAQKLLKELYKDNLPYYYYGTQTQPPEPGSFQDYTGGVKLLEYAEPQVQVTARLCAAAPEYLNTTSAISYLNSVISRKDSQPEEVAAAYMGLAALRQPVLLDVRYLLENEDSLGLNERLYLIAALAYIGDLDSAKKAYSEIAAPILMRNDPWVYLNTGGTRDSDIESTALAALTAMAIGEPEAQGMLRYIVENCSNEVTTCLERLAYIRHNPHAAQSKASFSYMENGKRKTESLEGTRPVILNMTADELKSADFRTISGDVGVCASYTGSALDIVNKNAKFVTLKKTVEPVGGNTIKQSGLVKITISPTFGEDAPKGWYELSDYIPSGLRYVSCKEDWDDNWWLGDVEGQKVSFSVLNIDKADKRYQHMKMTPIVYYARATLTGDFVSDSAYIKNAKTAAWGMSERKEISVGE